MAATVAAFASGKGGPGKTTTLVGCAHEAAAQGKKVLVVEIDGQRNASQWLTGGNFNDWFYPTLAEVLDTNLPLGHRAHLADAIVPSLREGIDLVPADGLRRMEKVNNVVAGRKNGQFALQRALKPVLDKYDYIFLDCIATANAINIAAFVASTAGIVLVAAPQQPSHSGAISLVMTIQQYNDPEEEDNLIDTLGREIEFACIVVNNYDGRKSAHKEYRRDLGDLADALHVPLIGPPVPALSLMELVPQSGVGLDQVEGRRDRERAAEIRPTYARILDTLDKE